MIYIYICIDTHYTLTKLIMLKSQTHTDDIIFLMSGLSELTIYPN